MNGYECCMAALQWESANFKIHLLYQTLCIMNLKNVATIYYIDSKSENEKNNGILTKKILTKKENIRTNYTKR